MDNETTRHMAWRNVHLDVLAMCEYEEGAECLCIIVSFLSGGPPG